MGSTAAPPRNPTGPEAGPEVDVARVLAERARLLAEPGEERAPVGESHLLAAAGGAKVALPTARARNVVAARPLSRLPGSGAAIIGLAAVQGGLVPVVDLSLLIAGAGGGAAAYGQLLLIDDRASRLGLRVDRVEGLISLGDAEHGARSAEPSTTPGLVARVAPGGVLVLDLDALLADPRLRAPVGAAVTTDTPDRDGAMPR